VVLPNSPVPNLRPVGVLLPSLFSSCSRPAAKAASTLRFYYRVPASMPKLRPRLLLPSLFSLAARLQPKLRRPCVFTTECRQVCQNCVRAVLTSQNCITPTPKTKPPPPLSPAPRRRSCSRCGIRTEPDTPALRHGF
jgi:hypothetical protein